jgi:hypothetical protein
MVRPPSSKVGRASFTTLVEIPLGEEVLAGTFFLYEHLIIILFDSGASHGFLSLTYSQKVVLTLCATQVPYSISTPGGQVVANQMARKIPLELAGQVFYTALIFMKDQGIDVILGMNWMKMHRVVLNISARLVHLLASVYAAIAKSLDEIHVVREYPDVFPDDLLGMPHDRAIEFKIELQPGTTPVYKRPYPMARNEMAELKTQLQELLNKGYIQPSCSPWGCPAIFVSKKETHRLCINY